MNGRTATPQDDPTEVAIAVSGLTKRFGDQVVVDSATFQVPYGAVTGFVGANGSGKTTTMRMIVGLTNADGGRALIDGVPYGRLIQPRRRVGAVLNRIGAHPGLTGRQHLRLICAGAALDDERIELVLDQVGLTDAGSRKVGHYSTGMSQRLALAAALLGQPAVLILDEPASGLDPHGIRWLRDLLRARADSGAAVFVSTHQLAELAPIVDHLVVIDGGRIVMESQVDELLARTGQSELSEAVLAVTP